ncbi:MAG: hypothetical protein WKG07_41975 [Hymenobacter sp.]
MPGQPYYKIKVTRDGLYRLDYAYLSQAQRHCAASAPTQPAAVAAGKEAGRVTRAATPPRSTTRPTSSSTASATTGCSTATCTKLPGDQAHPLYSFYTDTATLLRDLERGPGPASAWPSRAAGRGRAPRLVHAVGAGLAITDCVHGQPRWNPIRSQLRALAGAGARASRSAPPGGNNAPAFRPTTMGWLRAVVTGPGPRRCP